MKRVKILYTNYRGETAIRTIEPKELIFAENEYHKPAQWLLVAHDLDKNAERTFAMKDIKSWTSE
ncbi:hypothetical protein C4580_02235 [Candidatus Woesearchaeota archaeon]|nr:MAG: hypothetical protein C4580_02235 [Candidatus Woesearchaeota archaeon]